MIEINNANDTNYRNNGIWKLETDLRTKGYFYGVIYLYKNIANGKMYIGQSLSPYKRHRAHLRTSLNANDTDYTTPFHNAIRKYGASSFKYYILEIVKSEDSVLIVKDKLDKLEKEHIAKLSDIDKNMLYNVQSGGTVCKILSNGKSQTIYKFNKTGDFICEFKSFTEAAISVNGVANVIKKACKTGGVSYGHRWSLTKTPMPIKDRKVYRYNTKGEYVASYKNMSAAERELGICQSAISFAIANNSICSQSYWRKYKTDVLPFEEFPNAVCQYNLNGDFVAWYHSVNEAVKAINASGSSVICSAIKNYKSLHGYLWRRTKHDKIDPSENRYINKKAIMSIHPDGREVIHESIKMAALDNGVSVGTVNRCIRNKPTSCNIKFKRYNGSVQ